jgi:hypothetical protein
MGDVHDDIALSEADGKWNELDNEAHVAEETNYLRVHDPVNQAAVACEIIADVERLLLLMVDIPECAAWLEADGWDWVKRHHKVKPKPEVWLQTRGLGGTTLRYLAEEVLKDPAWVRHVDKVKECALQLLQRKPNIIAVACVWISMFHPEHASWCNLLLGRLCRLDKRLDAGTDWVLESSLTFGELSVELQDEAVKRLDEAEKAAAEAKAELERVSKPKFV